QKIVQYFTQHLEKKDQPAATLELKNILQAAKQIVAQIGGSQVDAFIHKQSSLKTVNCSSIFGQNIAFSFDTYVLDAQDTLPWSEGTDMEQVMDFQSYLNNHVGERRDGGDRDDAYSADELERRNPDSSILTQEVEKYLNKGNMVSSSAEELSTSLFEMLASTKSDDELQNELISGDCQFMCIRQKCSEKSIKYVNKQTINTINRMRDESTEPTYGCQVTIQSEQEKQMMKIYRKEEKKERKREKRGDTCENNFKWDS
uniref:Uncharacterized protein n=1 Tax=Cyprinus carpio carpio TaxID=630221 RepID=A0A8C0YN00_CYPCA